MTMGDMEEKIEFMTYELEENSGFLRSPIWKFKLSKSLVERCEVLLFWDSTHMKNKIRKYLDLQ